jgi:murein DD-endopeptidase MepM/ murein hydrolase activator NlpD
LHTIRWIVALFIGAVMVLGACEAAPPTAPSFSHGQCLARATFVDPAESEYCLPFPQGMSTQGRSHRTRFAYDFGCDLGDDVLAAREGVIEEVIEHWTDDDREGGHENRVLIRHADGTVAFYAHFQHQSIPVAVGDLVTTGQLIGSCGATGEESRIPHVHFEVFENAPFVWDQGIPVNFRNAEGILDARGGLEYGGTYAVGSCGRD